MTRRRRSRRRPPGGWPAPTSSGQATTLAGTAALIRGELRRHGADVVPLAGLPAALGITEKALRAAVDRSRDLGIGGPAWRPVLWRVDPAPLAVGFKPVYARERLTLQLTAADPARRPLVISGRHLDPRLRVDLDHDVDPDPTTASESGELGYALARLAAMSIRWLTEGHKLFPLIERAWQTSPVPLWSSNRLQVHCAEFGEPIATQFWTDNTPATRLELVLWTDPQDDLVLVNLYPCTTRHPTPTRDPEDRTT